MNRKKRVSGLIREIDALIREAVDAEKDYAKQLKRVHPTFARSARNLVHYRVVRRHDIRSLQKRLGNLGLSRLADLESHVLASLSATRSILRAFVRDKRIKLQRPDFAIKEGNRLLNSNAKSLLGYRSRGRRTRIMVTLPSEAAQDYRLVRELVEAGMNCARINCAHDDAAAWKQMIRHVRKAGKKLKRKCQVAMDLGGPKIRSGPLQPGPPLVKIRPLRDIRGSVTHPARVWLSPGPPPSGDALHLPVGEEAWRGFSAGDTLYFRDLRGKKRQFTITSKEAEGLRATCSKTAYVQTGTALYSDRAAGRPSLVLGSLPHQQRPIILRKGDRLRVCRDPSPGEPARTDEQGRMVDDAHVSCTPEEVFQAARPGQPILFDDGKIEGVIRNVSEAELMVEIVATKPRGSKLRADRGINLPDTRLTIRGLTDKDRQDLSFVAVHADVVNVSFVNRPADVKQLLEELEKHDALGRLGVILKIETKSGFNNLTDIMLEAMRTHPVGIMIARGDLAIECGWTNMARIQEEIQSLCRAAHMPDVWATQVLENLAKKGMPSRAEITDVAMAQRAECVMLNKGPHVRDAIQLLDHILKDLQQYHVKNAPMLPILEKASTRKQDGERPRKGALR